MAKCIKCEADIMWVPSGMVPDKFIPLDMKGKNSIVIRKGRAFFEYCYTNHEDTCARVKPKKKRTLLDKIDRPGFY